MTRPTLAQLEAFFWIVQLGSFQRAAAKLHLSPPTISLRIRQLEAATGAPLFDRQAHPFLLSEQGEAMFELAQQMVSLAKRIEARFSPISTSAGIVRLGLPESVAKACLSELFLKVRKLAPKLQLDVTVDSSSSINRRLRNLSLDIGILAEADVGPPIRVEPIGRNPLSWLGSPAMARSIEACTPTQAADLPIVTTPEPSQTRAVIMEWFAGAGLEPRRLSTCNSLSMISRLIRDGVGIGVLPIVMVQEELAAKALVLLSCRPQLKARTLQAAYHTEGVGAPGRVIEAVVEVVRKTLSLRVPLLPTA
jgi:DNA-binding transcriptional LysR family regulator